MSTTLSSQPVSGGVRVNGRSPLAWALRQALAGIVILAVSIGGAAWLLYAAIDPEVEAGLAAKSALRKTTIIDGTTTTRPALRPAGAIAAQ